MPTCAALQTCNLLLVRSVHRALGACLKALSQRSAGLEDPRLYAWLAIVGECSQDSRRLRLQAWSCKQYTTRASKSNPVQVWQHEFWAVGALSKCLAQKLISCIKTA